MPRERPGRRRRDEKQSSGNETQAAIAEFVRLLGQIHPSEAASRLQLDMARDAGLDAFRQLAARIKRHKARRDRARQRRRIAQDRLLAVLHDLASGPFVLPRPQDETDVPIEALLATFHELTGDDFPGLARQLHDAIGPKADLLALRCFLVEEVFAKSSCILVEHLVRRAARSRPDDDEARFLDDLRHHIAGKINRTLARQMGYQVTPEVGRQLDALLVKSLHFLHDLLAGSSPARLILPLSGAPFDPQRHDPAPGRPASGTLVVRATLSPGFVLLEQPPRLLARAQVYTTRVRDEVSPEGPLPPDEAG